MEKLLTIIVPTYNMEVYLDKCLTSLIVGEPDCEMMQNLEVLVINDGSTDRSSEIANGYETRFPNTFRVVDKENGNYGSCINVALPLATGKYVKILDADDWFDTEVFKEYLVWLKDKEVDAVFTDFYKVRNDAKTLINQLKVEPYKTLSFDDHYTKMLSLWMHGVTYNLKIFEGLDYHQTEGIFYTDTEWVFLPMSVVQKFIYYPKALYCYLIDRCGQTTNFSVIKANLSMQVKVAISCAQIYGFCCEEVYSQNKISVCKDYLRRTWLKKNVSLYERLLNKVTPTYAECLSCMDFGVLKASPQLYQELNYSKYPSWKNNYSHLSFRVIRTFHKYGLKVTLMQLWFINHYLGILSRWNRLKMKILGNCFE